MLCRLWLSSGGGRIICKLCYPLHDYHNYAVLDTAFIKPTSSKNISCIDLRLADTDNFLVLFFYISLYHRSFLSPVIHQNDTLFNVSTPSPPLPPLSFSPLTPSRIGTTVSVSGMTSRPQSLGSASRTAREGCSSGSPSSWPSPASSSPSRLCRPSSLCSGERNI